MQKTGDVNWTVLRMVATSMEFNPIRNKIRQFTFSSLADELLALLKEQERGGRISAFWHPLILLKWALEFAEKKLPAKQAQRRDVYQLLAMVEQLEMAHGTFNLKSNGRVSKTFTILAFQQFTYQEQAFLDTFSRQFVLFNQLKHKHDIAATFQEFTGLTIVELLKIFRLLWVFILNDVKEVYQYKGFIDRILMLALAEMFGQAAATKVVHLLSVSRDTIGHFLAEDTRQVKDYALQMFDVSFFTRKPFLAYRGAVIVPHRALLNQTFNYFIYDYLKHRDVKFSTELGARMEKYMLAGLQEVGIRHTTENQLRAQLGKTHKVVDFLLEDGVLVEAKAIELKPYVGVNPEDRLLSQELRQTIVKAYAEQMLAVVNALAAGAEYFGLIVTYKEMYLGNSKDLWEQFLEEETLRVLGEGEERLRLLPIQNLFFLDLHTWDLLLQVLKDNAVSLVSILQEIREADADPLTKKFSFAMHLQKYHVEQFTHQYLVKAREEVNPVH